MQSFSTESSCEGIKLSIENLMEGIKPVVTQQTLVSEHVSDRAPTEWSLLSRCVSAAGLTS